MSGKFNLSDKDFNKIINSLDSTGGYLVKRNELEYWIEFFVNQEVTKIVDKHNAYLLRVKKCLLGG